MATPHEVDLTSAEIKKLGAADKAKIKKIIAAADADPKRVVRVVLVPVVKAFVHFELTGDDGEVKMAPEQREPSTFEPVFEDQDGQRVQVGAREIPGEVIEPATPYVLVTAVEMSAEFNL